MVGSTATGPSGAYEDLILTATGSTTPSMTYSGTIYWIGVGIAVDPPDGVPTPAPSEATSSPTPHPINMALDYLSVGIVAASVSIAVARSIGERGEERPTAGSHSGSDSQTRSSLRGQAKSRNTDHQTITPIHISYKPHTPQTEKVEFVK